MAFSSRVNFPHCDEATLARFEDELVAFAERHLLEQLPTHFDHRACQQAAGELLDTVADKPLVVDASGNVPPGQPLRHLDGTPLDPGRQWFIRNTRTYWVSAGEASDGDGSPPGASEACLVGGWRVAVSAWQPGREVGLETIGFGRLTSSPDLHPYSIALHAACSALAAYAAGDQLGPPHVRWRTMRHEVVAFLDYIDKPLRPAGWWVDEFFRQNRAKLLHRLISGQCVARSELMKFLEYGNEPKDVEAIGKVRTNTNDQLIAQAEKIGQRLEIVTCRVGGKPGYLLRSIK